MSMHVVVFDVLIFYIPFHSSFFLKNFLSLFLFVILILCFNILFLNIVMIIPVRS